MEQEHFFKVGMTCSGCSSAVERVLKRTQGVSFVDISLQDQKVTVRSNLSQEQVLEAIKKSGKPVQWEYCIGQQCTSLVSQETVDVSFVTLAGRTLKAPFHLPDTQTLSCACIARDVLAVGEMGHAPRISILNLHAPSIMTHLKKHAHGIHCIALSPLGKFLVSIGQTPDDQILLWDWKKKLILGRARSTKKIHAVAFDPNEQCFMTAGDQHLKFWTLPKSSIPNHTMEPPLLKGHAALLGEHHALQFVSVVASVNKLKESCIYALSENGILLLLKMDYLVDRWVDVKMGKATCLDLAGDLIVCGGAEGLIRLFEHGTLAYRGTLPKPSPMNSPSGHTALHITHDLYYPDTTAVSLHKDGKTLGAIYSDHSFVTWDLSDMNNYQMLQKNTAHADCIWGIVVCFYDCLKQIMPLLGAYDQFMTHSGDGTVRLWSVDPQGQVSNLKTSLLDQIAMKCIKDRRDYMGTLTRKLMHLDVSYTPTRQGIRSVAISVKQNKLACGDFFGNIRIYSLDQMTELQFIEAHDGEVMCIDFSEGPEVCLMASCSRDRLVHVFNANDNFKLLQTLSEHTSTVLAVKFCQGHQKLVSCSIDKSLVFREWKSDSMYATYHSVAGQKTIYDIAYDSKREEIFAVTQDKSILSYALNTGKPLRSFKPDQIRDPFFEAGHFIRIAIHPDKGLLAAACSDKSILLLNINSGQWLDRAHAHSELITGLAFTVNGERLISTGADSLVFIWSIDSLQMNETKLKRASSESVLAAKTIEGNVHDTLPLWVRSHSKSELPPGQKTLVPQGKWAQRVSKEGIRLHSESDLLREPVAIPGRSSDRRLSIEISVENVGDLTPKSEPLLSEPLVNVTDRSLPIASFGKSAESLLVLDEVQSIPEVPIEETLASPYILALDQYVESLSLNRQSYSNTFKRTSILASKEVVPDKTISANLKDSFGKKVPVEAVGIVIRDEGPISTRNVNDKGSVELKQDMSAVDHQLTIGEVEDDDDESVDANLQAFEIKEDPRLEKIVSEVAILSQELAAFGKEDQSQRKRLLTETLLQIASIVSGAGLSK